MAHEDEEDFYNSGNLDESPRHIPGHNSGDDGLEGLSLSDLLGEMQLELYKDLLRNIKAGIATPQEKATAAKLLKDNGLVFLSSADDSSRNRDKEPIPLPTFGKPDYDR